MGDTFPKFKAATIQAVPVFLNREASFQPRGKGIRIQSQRLIKPHWVLRQFKMIRAVLVSARKAHSKNKYIASA